MEMATTTAAAAATVAETTGYVEVEAVRGRSTVTRCFSKYPLKLLVPAKVSSHHFSVLRFHHWCDRRIILRSSDL